ncbi:S8 family serine peptidase [Roseivivax sp. CAU 1753]
MATGKRKTASWKDIGDTTAPFDGYAHWEAASARRNPRAVMLFAELRPGKKAPTLRAAIAALRSEPRAKLQSAECDALATELAELDRSASGASGSDGGDLSPPPPAFPWRVTVAFFWLDEISKLPDYCRLLHVGPRVEALSETDPRMFDPIDRAPTGTAPGAPVMACIDDGIGYLNARFRASATETRIAKLWLQTEPRAAAHDLIEPLPDVRIGQVLAKAEIDRELASGVSETALYRARNDALLPPDLRRSTNHHASHGTHVLDLAAGADWADTDARDDGDNADACIAGLPILAVQLPPAAIAETSGRKTEGYVAIGLRWIVTEALRLSRCDGRPVIVNLSLGALAGPGDHTAFLAQWIAAEIDRYERLCGGRLQVVAAYGNARLDQLAARAEVTTAAPLSLDWRVQPDDRTASFLELRTTCDGTGRRLCLTPPDPRLPPLELEWLRPGEGRLLMLGRDMLAAVYGTETVDLTEDPEQATAPAPETRYDSLLIALAPTHRVDGGAPVPAGCWKIAVASDSATPSLVTAEVQRDDTPHGFRPRGRQSYLDAPGWEWDAELGSASAPAAGNPVSRQGTAVAFAGATHAHLWFVGAARPRTGAPGTGQPERYSAEGIVDMLARAGQSPGPTLAARGSDGAMQQGARAAGVLTGSVARFSGTSVAAPRVARALAQLWSRTGAPGDPEADLAAILAATPPLPGPDCRTGRGVMLDYPHSRTA